MPSRTSSVFHIGLDDTDSAKGMCTTFLTYQLVRALTSSRKKTRLIDYPNLIRLNPNIPWKTRGNGALVIRIETQLRSKEIFDICKEYINKFATSKNANAGLVVHEGESIPEPVIDFSRRALSSVVSIKETRGLIEKFGMSSYFLRSGQGLVGALAGIGNELLHDFTFELIAYRINSMVPRIVEKEKVLLMSHLTYPKTFNSYDEKNDRVLIAPHGPDPVLLGIRGETPAAVLNAFRILRPIKNLAGYMIFRTNQGTGEHLEEYLDLARVRSYSSGKVEGKVLTKPEMNIGGHVFWELGNHLGSLKCACYEPTGRLREVAMSLLQGDQIEVGGGVRRPSKLHSKTLNVEYILALSLIKNFMFKNPKCSKCKVSMKSEGKDQGFRCEKCGRIERLALKREVLIPRIIREGELHLPDLKAHRHLTKPLQRYAFARTQRARSPYLVRDWMLVGSSRTEKGSALPTR